MGRKSTPEEGFREYLETLAAALRHRDRLEPLRAYLTGLLLPGERKSVEPMAAKVDPMRLSARHQSMHHFVAKAPWDERDVLRVARNWALDQMERHGPVAAWVVDDTAIPKKGTHSVGVARQYCGVLGKQENCQVAVTVSLVNPSLSIPVAYRLYLPEGWARDPRRRKAAGVPEAIGFQTKWEIALSEIDSLLAEQIPLAPVVADSGYGVSTAFRQGLTERGFSYVVGITAETTVWPPNLAPLPPKHGRGKDAPRSCCAALSSIGRSKWLSWPQRCPGRLGTESPGEREPGARCNRSLAPSAFGLPIGTTGETNLTPCTGS